MTKKQAISKTRKILSYIIFALLIFCTFIFFGLDPLLNKIDNYEQKNSLSRGGTVQLIKSTKEDTENTSTEYQNKIAPKDHMSAQ
ncbi:MAG: hypothetical protein ACTHOO_05775 [Alcanivorax sp.]